MLSHPIVADIRADQEARQFKEIGNETIQSLVLLKDIGVPEKNIHLFFCHKNK